MNARQKAKKLKKENERLKTELNPFTNPLNIITFKSIPIYFKKYKAMFFVTDEEPFDIGYVKTRLYQDIADKVMDSVPIQTTKENNFTKFSIEFYLGEKNE